MHEYIARAEIHIPVEPETVWEALTDPDQIKHFMFGANVETDWEPGSPITWSGEFDGKPYQDRGAVLEVEPFERLVVTHFSPLTGQEDAPENYHTLRYRLEKTGSGTLVSLQQDNNRSQLEADTFAKNWSEMLHALREYLLGDH